MERQVVDKTALPEQYWTLNNNPEIYMAGDELKLHVNAALNVGCDPKKLAEVFFQVATYAGMPTVNEALNVFKEVLIKRGEWPIGE